MTEDKQIELELDSSTDVEVEVPQEEGKESPVETAREASDQDQFEKAESATQKRINSLTKKMREAEKEAVNYAKNIQNESNTLKARLNNLDSSYINEYDNRVQSQMSQAEKDLARAMEIGDSQAAVVANKQIAELSVQNSQLNQAKAQQERQKAVNQQQAYAPQQYNQPVQQQQQVKRPDPKAEDWASNNDWFGQDEAMTFAAFGIHKRLVEEEGFDPRSDEYYTELDRRIEDKFNMPTKGTSRRPVQTVASVSRSSGRSSGKKVRLTPSQVAIAKKLGVPLEEYAKYVKE